MDTSTPYSDTPPTGGQAQAAAGGDDLLQPPTQEGQVVAAQQQPSDVVSAQEAVATGLERPSVADDGTAATGAAATGGEDPSGTTGAGGVMSMSSHVELAPPSSMLLSNFPGAPRVTPYEPPPQEQVPAPQRRVHSIDDYDDVYGGSTITGSGSRPYRDQPHKKEDLDFEEERGMLMKRGTDTADITTDSRRRKSIHHQSRLWNQLTHFFCRRRTCLVFWIILGLVLVILLPLKFVGKKKGGLFNSGGIPKSAVAEEYMTDHSKTFEDWASHTNGTSAGDEEGKGSLVPNPKQPSAYTSAGAQQEIASEHPEQQNPDEQNGEESDVEVMHANDNSLLPPEFHVTSLTCPLPGGIFDWKMSGDEILGPTDAQLKAEVTEYGHAVAMDSSGTVVVVAVQDTTKKYGYVDLYEYKNYHEKWQRAAHLEPADGVYAHRGPQHQTCTMSSNGNVVALTQSDDITVYRKFPFSGTDASSTGHGEWHQWGKRIDYEYGTGGLHSPPGHHFALDVALNHNGLVLAVLGTVGTAGYVRLLEQVDVTEPLLEDLSLGKKESIWKHLVPDLVIDHPGSAGELGGVGTIAVSGAGTRVAFGMPPSRRGAGVVQVFDVTDDRKKWNQVGNNVTGLNDGFWLGSALDLSADGETLAVGSTAGKAGYVQVYKYKNGQWILRGQTLLANSILQHYGQSVQLSGDGNVLAVGAPGHAAAWGEGGPPTDNENLAKYMYGNVFVYQYNEQCDEWFPVSVSGEYMNAAKSSITSPHVGDTFGHSVALNQQGNRLVGGAPLAHANTVPDVGGAMVYDLILT